MTALAIKSHTETLADVLLRLGSVPTDRIAAYPAPGSATEADLLSPRSEDRLYELVDGVLVEKAMGYIESILAGALIHLLWNHLEEHDLGIVLGADGLLRLAPGLVRAPDVSFISWDRFPGGQLAPEPIPDLVPDLAIEVLSVSNTGPEMERKLKDYFTAGSQLLWYVDPRMRTIHVYTSPTDRRELGEGEALEGGAVLPGFTLSITDLFRRVDRRAPGAAAENSR